MTTEQLDFEAAMIIADKKRDGKGPYVATLLELAKATGESPATLIPLMRQLIRQGKYSGSTTVNGTPMLMTRRV